MGWLLSVAIVFSLCGLLSFAMGRTFADALPFLVTSTPLWAIWVGMRIHTRQKAPRDR